MFFKFEIIKGGKKKGHAQEEDYPIYTRLEMTLLKRAMKCGSVFCMPVLYIHKPM